MSQKGDSINVCVQKCDRGRRPRRLRGRHPHLRSVSGPGEAVSRQERLWTRSFIAIIGSNFFTAVVFYLLSTTIASYIMDRFSVGESLAGLCVGSYSIGAIGARVFAGRYMDTIGRRRLAYVTTAACIGLNLGYMIVGSIPVMLLLRLVHGFCFGAASTVLNTIAVVDMPEAKRGEGTAYLTLSSTAATAIGPFIGMLLTQHMPYRAVLVCCVVCAVLAMAALAAGGIPRDVRRSLPPRKGADIRDFFEMSTFPIGMVMCIAAICYAAVTAFISGYAEETGLSALAPYYFTVYAAALLVSRPLTGRLLDRRGDNMVIYPALGIFVAAFLLLSLGRSAVSFLVSAVCVALGYGTIQSAGQAIAVKYAPPERIGLATSTFYLFLDVGIGVGPFLTGALVTPLGYARAYMALIVPVLAGVLIYRQFHARRIVRREAAGNRR